MNEDIKRKIKENRICQYEIAGVLGVSEYTIIRWFRKPLSAERRLAILDAIEKIKAGAIHA